MDAALTDKTIKVLLYNGRSPARRPMRSSSWRKQWGARRRGDRDAPADGQRLPGLATPSDQRDHDCTRRIKRGRNVPRNQRSACAGRALDTGLARSGKISTSRWPLASLSPSWVPTEAARPPWSRCCSACPRCRRGRWRCAGRHPSAAATSSAISLSREDSTVTSQSGESTWFASGSTVIGGAIRCPIRNDDAGRGGRHRIGRCDGVRAGPGRAVCPAENNNGSASPKPSGRPETNAVRRSPAVAGPQTPARGRRANRQPNARAFDGLGVVRDTRDQPIMAVVDRVLYLVGTRWAVGNCRRRSSPAQGFPSCIRQTSRCSSAGSHRRRRPTGQPALRNR